MDGPTLASNGCPRPGGGSALCGPADATRSLVLWSGGIDSTYTLLRLLRESGDAVYSHHVRIERTPDPAGGRARSDLEEVAIARLRPVLAAVARPFVHTTSRVDLSALGASGGDAALLGFLAAHAGMAHDFTPFDRVLLGVNADRDPGWAPGSAACALRRARLARALRAAWGCDEVPQIYLWEPRPAKAAMWDYLGPDIAPLTVSCLHPRHAGDGTGPVPCGECPRCAWRAAAPGGSAVGATGGGGALSGVPEPAGAEPSPPPFRHLVRALSETPAPGDPDAASDPPAP